MIGGLGETNGGLLTPRQVSEIFQIKLPRIYELVRTRRLRAVRVGRQLRFRPSAVEQFIERNEVKG